MAKQRSGFICTVIALISKGTKLLSLFKVAKPLIMLISMSISAIAYAFWFGPWLSILFIGLLLVHEMGHVAAYRIKNLGTPPVVFIPFLGAAMFSPAFKERDTEAFVGYGGPLLGTLASLIVFGASFLTQSHSMLTTILLVGSYLGVYLNLFNLIPISPLDGGRVTQAVGSWFKYVGLIILAAFSVWFRSPVILYIWILVLFDLTIIPVKLRAILISSIWIAMVRLMSLGYGNQPLWVNMIECVITIMFVGMAIFRAFNPIEDVEPDTRPQLSKSQQTKWGIVYIALAAVLVVTLVLQVHLLPKIHH